MSRINRSLVFGGTAVLGLFVSGSILLAAPKAPAPAKLPSLAPFYLSYVNPDGQDSLLRRLGVTQTIVDAKADTAPEKVRVNKVTATADAVQTTVPNAVRVAQTKIAAHQAAAKPKVVSRSTGPATDPGIIGYALSFRGLPYRFGGTSPGTGFDCSGFTKYVFGKFGISLPRSSYEQYHAGSPIAKGDLKPGDLVFFTTYTRGPSHVGIYMGGGRFVDSSNRGVVVQDMTTGYYGERYLGARRVNK